MSSKEYFDRVAQQWDRMRESLFLETVRDKTFSTADMQKGNHSVNPVFLQGKKP